MVPVWLQEEHDETNCTIQLFTFSVVAAAFITRTGLIRAAFVLQFGVHDCDRLHGLLFVLHSSSTVLRQYDRIVTDFYGLFDV